MFPDGTPYKKLPETSFTSFRELFFYPFPIRCSSTVRQTSFQALIRLFQLLPQESPVVPAANQLARVSSHFLPCSLVGNHPPHGLQQRRFITGRNNHPVHSVANNLAAPVDISHDTGQAHCPCLKHHIYNPQIQISVVSGTKRSIFRQKNKTKRSKKKAAHNTYKAGAKG